MVALILGRQVKRVSILPKHERLGTCEFGKGAVRPTEDWLEREILIALGGIAAEARFTGNYSWDGAGSDQQYVERLAVKRAGEAGLNGTSVVCWRKRSICWLTKDTGRRSNSSP